MIRIQSAVHRSESCLSEGNGAWARPRFFSAFCFLLTGVFLVLLPLGNVVEASESDTQAMYNLVQLDQVDRRVVKSGLWSDPTLWSGGELPKSGENLHIPAGLIVTFDLDLSVQTKIRTLRVDGMLRFDAFRNARLWVDTLAVTETGSFIIGSETDRLQYDKNISIIVSDNGAIDREWDPANMSRGIILHGRTRIFGAEKSAFHPLAVYPGAGETKIQLAEDPLGWKVGDIVAITATKQPIKGSTYTTYDEFRPIQQISGREITLGHLSVPGALGPLAYSHIPPVAGMPVFAVNFTRNVAFLGEGGNLVPAKQKGHFIMMHSPDVIVKGAGFYHLGRTDKSIPLDDFLLDEDGIRLEDEAGNYIPGPNNNPRGRYAMHFHHTGIDSINDQPAISSGNVVVASPGWGFVIHSSNVLMENNASYDVFGSHFVTEDGNELGTVRHNIAIRSEGGIRGNKKGLGNHDHGHSGHGFWFQGRNMRVEDNVVSSAYRDGMIYYHRNAVSGINLNIPGKNLLTPHKETLKSRDSMNFDDVPVVHMKDLIVVSSGSALHVIKANKDQGHDLRNKFDSVKGYLVISGIYIEYTSNYTFTDLVLIADPGSGSGKYGARLERQTRSVSFVGAQIDGFVHPVVTGTVFKEKSDQTDTVFVDVKINGEPIVLEKDIHNLEHFPETVSNYDPNFHSIVDREELNPDRLLFNLASDQSVRLPDQLKHPNKIEIVGVKSDSAGVLPFSSTWDAGTMLVSAARHGYYTRADGSKFLMLKDLVSDRITGKVLKFQVPADLGSTLPENLGPNLGELNVPNGLIYGSTLADSQKLIDTIDQVIEDSGRLPNGYAWNLLDVGKLPYSDTNLKFAGIPEGSSGFLYLQAVNRDNSKRSGHVLDFKTVTDSVLYVCRESRLKIHPQWLKDWVDTGVNLTLDDNTVLRAYAKQFTKGTTIKIGGNYGDEDSKMLILGIQPL